MVTRDRIVGVFWFGHSEPDRYSEAQADYITAVAHHTAIAIENARHYQQIQTTVADRERNRLAQELHDSVSQTLLSAKMVAESLPKLWDMSPEQGKMALDYLQRMTQDALAEMRSLMMELRPTILAKKPLGEILHHLSDAFASRSQLPVHFRLGPQGDTVLPSSGQIAFYRIAQSAFNNILQHAEASEVTVELDCTESHVEMRIVDNGVGFDPAATPPDRLGLTIMRERAEVAGATLQVESAPGQGTKITVRYAYPIQRSRSTMPIQLDSPRAE
jgi:signal transduction histidine kinase